jgi:hypothetical protein
VEAAARDREAAVARSLVVEALLKQQFSFIFFFFYSINVFSISLTHAAWTCS